MKETSMVAQDGGGSFAVTLSTVSAQSAVLGSNLVTLYSTVDAFFRQGSNPTALATGVDQILPANTLMRVQMNPAYKLAFVASASGTVYITPGA